MILSGCCSHHRCSLSIIPRSLKTLGEEETLTLALSLLSSLCELFKLQGTRGGVGEWRRGEGEEGRRGGKEEWRRGRSGGEGAL